MYPAIDRGSESAAIISMMVTTNGIYVLSLRVFIYLQIVIVQLFAKVLTSVLCVAIMFVD